MIRLSRIVKVVVLWWQILGAALAIFPWLILPAPDLFNVDWQLTCLIASLCLRFAFCVWLPLEIVFFCYLWYNERKEVSEK